MTIGDRIKQERESRQLDRADMRKLTGFSMSYFHEVEANVFPPSKERVAKIAEAFGMTATELERGAD